MGEVTDIACRVRRVLQMHFGVMPEATGDEALLREDLDADSLDCIEVAMALEEEFDIEIADVEIEKVERVGDAVRLVERIMAVPAC